MARLHFDLVIVGNGIAGINAALAARKQDSKLTIAILGEENYPVYAAGALPDYLSGHLARDEVFIAEIKDYEKNNIHLLLGERVTTADPEIKTLTTDKENKIGYGKLIIATGSSPVQLRKMKGTDLPGNFVFKTIRDAESITAYNAKRAVVVGSGAIGLESALALNELGVKVTVVELLDWVLMKSLDRATADIVTNKLEEKGVTVLTGENVVSVDGESAVQGIKTNKRDMLCDMVLWAVGVRPTVDLARYMGVELGETGGIKVDDNMRTSLPDVYACGDCTESLDRFRGRSCLNLLWESAARQGSVAGSNCAGNYDAAFDGSFVVLVTYVGDIPIVAFGMTENDLANMKYRVLEKKEPNRYQRILLQDDRIVGAQMINSMEGAGMLIAQLQKGACIDREMSEREQGIRFPAHQAALAAYLNQFDF